MEEGCLFFGKPHATMPYHKITSLLFSSLLLLFLSHRPRSPSPLFTTKARASSTKPLPPPPTTAFAIKADITSHCTAVDGRLKADAFACTDITSYFHENTCFGTGGTAAKGGGGQRAPYLEKLCSAIIAHTMNNRQGSRIFCERRVGKHTWMRMSSPEASRLESGRTTSGGRERRSLNDCSSRACTDRSAKKRAMNGRRRFEDGRGQKT